MAFWGTSGPIACIPMTKVGLMAVPRIVYFVGPHNRWQTTSQTQKARIADGFWKVEKARKYSPLKPLLNHLTMNQKKQENSKRNGNTRPPYLPPEKPVCQSRSNRTGSGTMDWFKLRKGLWQECILQPCFFNFCAEYIMWNARLDESQAGIKISGRNNNLKYADDTTIMAKSKEELENLLMKVQKESEKTGLELSIQKTKIMASVPITS